ncbi:hypothetical protein AVEN_165966-1 [Araneus ventricosus]|uniref:Uncharacterized protein n=1 Tax=Araneus ventricosus TaxID=182803 RepID=A0A4Y2P0B5_ARAVE|nr:hypothetical protein AVEN_165966-1 [Araneus ventricosus]
MFLRQKVNRNVQKYGSSFGNYQNCRTLNLRPWRNPKVAKSSNVLNVLSGISPLHIVAKAMYLKFQIWVMLSSKAQLLPNINKIYKFIKTSEIPPEKNNRADW